MSRNALYLGRDWTVEHDRTFQASNAELKYAVLGKGEPVLCIHGTTVADSLITPLRFFPPLSDNYQLISYYRAGYGGSTLTKDSLSIEEGAEHVRELLDHLGLDRAHIMGFSFGGVIAFQFLLSHPERAHSAILLEPDELPSRGGWEFAARVRPAREVAGDFYDGFELVDGRRLGFVVADVCDKGVGAALFMALIRTLLRHTAEHTGGWSPLDDELAFGPEPLSPAAETSSPLLSVGASPLLHAVTGTNRYLVRNHHSQAYFATLFFGVLDPVSGLLIYVNGGHIPPVLARHADGEHVLLHPTGPAVGITEDSTYVIGHTHLAPGDVLFVYTDGVVEARDLNGQEYTIGRLREAMGRPTASALGLLESVDASLREHVSGADQFDDITMFVLRRSAQEAA